MSPKNITLIVFMILGVLLGGCATDYACPMKTEGKCQSVSDVYENINRNPNNKDEKEEISSQKKTNFVQPLEGNPVLKEPRVVRILMNYWEDDEKDLNLGGYIFVKVNDSEWSL